ncbi:MAG TPA: PH domain-containing protein [Sphingomicrobium sp.]|nr:PH domain-containing protein [Sphingomicrobium sp.]
MSAASHPFMGKVFVGNPVAIGTLRDKYQNVLMDDEQIEMEFKGVRDGMLLTDLRMIVLNSQGITGKKVEVTSFPWKSVTAYAVENSGTLDLDAELKICGSGWGVCEVQMTKGTNVRAVCQYLNRKIFG